MVPRIVNPPATGWSLTFRPRDWVLLEEHLFSDGDEHGAVVLARVVDGPRGPRLLASEVILAEDGVDYLPGSRGYRMLSATFVRDAAVRARAGGLAYLAFHNHGGTTRVDFSGTDLQSHERGYPALRRITGQLVGAVVCTPSAAAGDLWLTDGSRAPLAELIVPGRQLLRLRPAPAEAVSVDSALDRQTRLFGAEGQACFREMTVAVVGLGGVGSIVTEYLARLGIGHLILIDDDAVEKVNLSRLIAARRADVGRPKIKIARRNARRANHSCRVMTLRARVQDPRALRLLAQSDWIFLAADSHAARHWVNAIAETRLIPATQLGVQVPVSDRDEIGRIHAGYRRMTPGQGCFWCNGLIDSTELAVEMSPDAERKAARYVDGVPAASVITLNGLTAAEATTDFMLAVTGLSKSDPVHHFEFVRDRSAMNTMPRRDPDCGWCGAADPIGERYQVEARLRFSDPPRLGSGQAFRRIRAVRPHHDRRRTEGGRVP